MGFRDLRPTPEMTNPVMGVLPILRISSQSSATEGEKGGAPCIMGEALCVWKIMVLLSFQQIFKYNLSLWLINCRLRRT